MTNTSDRIASLRASFDSGKTRPEAWRRTQLERLQAMIEENEEAFNEALHADLGKSGFEARMTETGTVLAEIGHTLSISRPGCGPTRSRHHCPTSPDTARWCTNRSVWC
jgi:aldehyde dehydrogenase (NAD+)